MDEIKFILEKIEHEWLPATLELGAKIVYYNSIGSLIGCIVASVIAGLFYYLTYRGYKYAKHLYVASESPTEKYGFGEVFMWYNEDDDNIMPAIMMAAGALVGTTIAVFTGMQLTNIWMWIGIFDPKVALAREIMEKLLK